MIKWKRNRNLSVFRIKKFFFDVNNKEFALRSFVLMTFIFEYDVEILD